jgi:hypothetical protein
MPWCDVCNTELKENSLFTIKHETMASAFRAGFRPREDRFARTAKNLNKSVDEVREKWVDTMLTLRNDFRLCDACKHCVERALNVVL